MGGVLDFLKDAPVIGGLVGAAGSWFSGKQAADAAKENYKHRYQWQVQDLKKAGLNPMLSVQNSPGSVAQPNFENIGEGAVKGFSAGQQAKLLSEQYETQKATTQKTLAEAEALGIKNKIDRASPLYQEADKAYDYTSGVQGPSAAAAQRWTADLALVQNQAEKLKQDTEVAKLTADLQRGQITLQEIQIQYAPTLAKIEAAYRAAIQKAAEAGVPEAQASAEFWQNLGALGKIALFIKNLTPGK